MKNVGSESDQNLWWGSINQPTTPEIFDELYTKAVAHFNSLGATLRLTMCTLCLRYFLRQNTATSSMDTAARLPKARRRSPDDVVHRCIAVEGLCADERLFRCVSCTSSRGSSTS